MYSKTHFLTTVFLLIVATALIGQDDNTYSHDVNIHIPEVALLDIESEEGDAILLQADAPEEAGLPLEFNENTNDDLWINYTSIIGSETDPARDVTVQITSGDVPAGLQLAVKADKAKGKGEGKFGNPVGKIYLSNNAKTLISGVGSAYTGDGVKNGHRLRYKLEMNDLSQFGQLDHDQTQQALSITYTLTDN